MALEQNVRGRIDEIVRSNRVVLFMKGNRRFPQCGFSQTVVGILDQLVPTYETVNVLSDPAIRDGIKAYSDWPTIPQLYVDGAFVGGCDIVRDLNASGELRKMLTGGEAAPASPAKAPKITVTSAAAEAFLAASGEAGEELLRLEIGASFQNDLFFGPRKEGDLEITSSGVTLLVDRATASRADGVTIDWVERPGGSGFAIENPNEPPRVKQITPQELKAMLGGADAPELFDVRTDAERGIAVIASARPFDDEARSHLEALDRSTPIAFHCHHGVRSQSAAAQYLEKGFRRVYNLRGGIDAWSATVDPSIPRY